MDLNDFIKNNKKLFEEQSDMLLNFNKDKDGKCIMFGSNPVDATVCTTILEKCVKGGDVDKCNTEWNKLNLQNGVNYDTIHPTMAETFLKGLKFEQGQFEKNEQFKDRGELSVSLKNFINGLAAHVGWTTKFPEMKQLERRGVQMRVPVPLQMGGGSTINHTRMFNHLKNQLNQLGGQSYAVSRVGVQLRGAFNNIVTMLKQNGKEIEGSDKKKMENYINSLVVHEARAEEDLKKIFILQKIMTDPVKAKELSEKVSQKEIDDLYNKYKDTLGKVHRRSVRLVEILEAIQKLAGVPERLDKIEARLPVPAPAAAAAP